MGILAKKAYSPWRWGVVAIVCAVVMAAGVATYRTGSAAEPKPQTSSPTYGQVQSLLQANCLGCHTSTTKMGGLIMETYEALRKGGAHGPVFVSGKSSESRMVLMLEGKIKPQMPFGGQPLPPADIALLKAWIDAGAKGPAPGETSTVSAPKLVIPDIKPQVPVVSPVGSLIFSPDGKLIAVGGYQEVRLVEAGSGKVVATLTGHADVVRALAFNPGGKWLAAAGGLPAQSGEIKLWDVQTHQLLRTLVGHKDCIYSVAVSPDGKLLASGSYDKLVKLWEAEAGKELRTLKDHIDAVFAVTFSPDGKRLASGAQDRTVKIWDVTSGERVFTLSEPLDAVTTVAYHPSGKQLAAAGADKIIRTWNLTDKGGSLAQSMFAHEDTILEVVYSPDGKTLISTSADRTIRLWDAATLNPMKALEKQPDWVQAMSVSADGRWLAVGRYDGTVSVYDLGTYQRVLGPLVAFAPEGPTTQTEARQAVNQ